MDHCKHQHETLTVRFRGITSHFRGVVPGVPHRVVAPNAMDVRAGEVVIDGGEPRGYMICPHALMLIADGKPLELGLPDLTKGAYIVNGVRLEIVNACGPLSYPTAQELSEIAGAGGTFDELFQLTEFVDHYRPSSDVLLGGRALCYFDFFSGTVTSENSGFAIHTKVEVKTHGTPRLRVTPLAGNPKGVQMPEWQYDLPAELMVSNCGPFCGKDSEFDFLLNYLTAEGGIPRATGDFPREPATLGERTERHMDLGAFVTRSGIRWPVAEKMLEIAAMDTTVACSDTRYP